jgi:NTE family protein
MKKNSDQDNDLNTIENNYHLDYHNSRRNFLTLISLGALGIGGLTSCSSMKTKKPVTWFWALGGGAARGFAHIGVIKALESQGVFPEPGGWYQCRECDCCPVRIRLPRH